MGGAPTSDQGAPFVRRMRVGHQGQLSVALGARPLALGSTSDPSTASSDRGFSNGAPMFTADLQD